MLPFFALNGSRTRISWQRQLSCCSVHSMLVLKIKIKCQKCLFSFCLCCMLFVSFFFTVSRTLSYLPHVKDTFTNINNRQVIITKRKYLYMHSLFKTQRKKKQNLRSNLLGTRAGCSHDLFSGEEKRRFFFFFSGKSGPRRAGKRI